MEKQIVWKTAANSHNYKGAIFRQRHAICIDDNKSCNQDGRTSFLHKVIVTNEFWTIISRKADESYLWPTMSYLQIFLHLDSSNVQTLGCLFYKLKLFKKSLSIYMQETVNHSIPSSSGYLNLFSVKTVGISPSILE